MGAVLWWCWSEDAGQCKECCVHVGLELSASFRKLWILSVVQWTFCKLARYACTTFAAFPIKFQSVKWCKNEGFGLGSIQNFLSASAKALFLVSFYFLNLHCYYYRRCASMTWKLGKAHCTSEKIFQDLLLTSMWFDVFWHNFLEEDSKLPPRNRRATWRF